MKIKRFLNRKGFSLAEMLLVVAILVILMAVAAPNVAKYVKAIKLRELDDSARSIFMAAEHELKSDIEMGRDIAKDGELYVPARYTDGGAENIDKINYTIYKGTLSPGGIISTSSIEPELAANNYVIEFNAETGDVYGVFYSTEPTEFDDYKEKYNDDSGKYAAAVNKTADRVGTLGYYGLENTAITAPIKPDKIPEPEVKVINAEKLVLEVTNPALNPNAYVTVSANGVDIVPRETGAYIVANNKAVFILDTLEGNTDNITVKSLYGVVFEKPFSEWAKDASGNYRIKPGENLEIKVTFYDPKGVALDQTKTVKANSLFANGSSPETANIEYGRHLQNLGECDTVTTVSVDRTLDFNKTGGEKYECWADEYPGRHFNPISNISTVNISAKPGVEIRNIYIDGEGLFSYISGTAKNLKFVNPTVIGDYSAGTLCGSAYSLNVENIEIENPKIETSDGYGYAGGIVALYSNGTVKNCAVYVSGNKTDWLITASDPYAIYSVNGGEAMGFAGGMIALADGEVNIVNSYASVKVSGYYAGGLIGTVSGTTKITDSFAGGHTYYGVYDGKAKDDTEVHLKDNIFGTCAGGIVGNHQSTDDLELYGTVFSTCSVTGSAGSDVFIGHLVYKTIVIDPDATVYALGTAYITDNTGKETPTKDSQYKPTAAGEKGVLSAADFGTYTGSSGARRYDTLVSSVFKYPLPYGMIMHGDWPSGEPVTGFFYWENEDGAYKIRALYYDPQNPNLDGLPKEGGSLGNADDVAVSESGYGIFCIDGDVTDAKYYPREVSGFSATPIDDFSKVMDEVSPADSRNGEIVTALKEALKTDSNLKITDSNFNTAIYITGDGKAKKGSIKATLNEKTFTFAPYFYGLEGGESGFGNEAKPFEVRTAKHLDNVRYFLSMNFKQGHDLLPGAIKPIGDGTNPFKGTYDGGVFEIIDMKITVSDPSEPAGMFGTTDGATLKNIVLRASAENTNFVETSPALPTATALSALAGSPISGINEMLAAVDGEGETYQQTVKVGEKIDSNIGYVIFRGEEARGFLEALKVASQPGQNLQLRISPEAQSNCAITCLWSQKDQENSAILKDVSKVWSFMSDNNGYLICSDLSTFNNIENNFIDLYKTEPYTKAGLQYTDLNSDLLNFRIAIYYDGKDMKDKYLTLSIGAPINHKHQFDDTWKYDSEKHWHECTVEDCDSIEPDYPQPHDIDPTTGKCTVCGYTKKHEHIWKDAGQKHRCDGCGAEEDHIFSSSQYFNNNQHTSTCEICGKTEYRNHGGSTVKNNVTSHWTECDDCHYKMNYERHSFEEVDGRQVCKKCGYTKPIPAALANNVLGGLVGEAKSTAADKPTVIKDCTVDGYTLDPDSALVSLLPGGGPTLKFDDYHFSHFYEMIPEYDGNQNFSIISLNLQTDESIKGGFSCEMERLIKSAYYAIAAGHPEYEYRFRIQMKNGDYTQGSIGNLFFYSPDAPNTCAINMVSSGDVGFTVEPHDDSRKETIDGKEVTYRVRTALDLIYALEISWPNQGYNYSDFKNFGLYILGETSYVQGQGSINTGANDQQPSTSNSVIGGIAAKTVAKTSITDCKVLNVTFGDAAIAGGIVGEASECKTAAPTISDNKALVNGFNGSINKSTRLGGILAVKDDNVNLEKNKAAFKGLDPLSWQYVFAVAPDASETNKYVSNDKTAGYAKGLHTGVNEEKAQEISLEDFNNSWG